MLLITAMRFLPEPLLLLLVMRVIRVTRVMDLRCVRQVLADDHQASDAG